MSHRVITFDDLPDLDEEYDLPDGPERVENPSRHQVSRLERRLRAYAEECLSDRGLYLEMRRYRDDRRKPTSLVLSLTHKFAESQTVVSDVVFPNLLLKEQREERFER